MNKNESSQKKSEIDFKKMDNSGKWLLGIGLLFLIVGPAIFTQALGLLDFTETGQIGDTIGGITSPFINLIGAALVYLSFREQMKTNNNQYTILLGEVEQRKYTEEKEALNTLFKQTEDVWNNLNSNMRQDFNKGDIYRSLHDYIEHYKIRSKSLEKIIIDRANDLRKTIVAMNKLNQLYDTILLAELKERDRSMMFDQYTYLLLDRLVYFKKFSKKFFDYPYNSGMNKSTQQIFDAYKKESDSLSWILNDIVDKKKI